MNSPVILSCLFGLMMLFQTACSLQTKDSIESAAKEKEKADAEIPKTPKQELLALITATQNQQLEVQKDLSALYEPWKNLVEHQNQVQGPPTDLKSLKESFLKTRDALMRLSEQIENVRSMGENYFDLQEQQALTLTDPKVQSDRYRAIMKNRRQFRLLYLSLNELGLKSGQVYKTWRRDFQQFVESNKASLQMNSQTNRLMQELNDVEEKIRKIQKQSEVFSKDFGQQTKIKLKPKEWDHEKSTTR